MGMEKTQRLSGLTGFPAWALNGRTTETSSGQGAVLQPCSAPAPVIKHPKKSYNYTLEQY